MKMKLIVFGFLFISLISCQQKMKKDSPQELKKVISNYFDAIKSKDFETMKALVTDDFVLYENGKIWNNDSLIAFIDSLPGYQATFALKEFNITIDNYTGSMYYINNADFEFNDTTQLKFMWIESATFKKVDDKWEMNFLHSTLVNE